MDICSGVVSVRLVLSLAQRPPGEVGAAPPPWMAESNLAERGDRHTQNMTLSLRRTPESERDDLHLGVYAPVDVA